MENQGNDKVIEIMLYEIREIKQDVKSLLSFKWQLIGGSMVLSCLSSFAINLILK
jgi:hypothetical protein